MELCPPPHMLWHEPLDDKSTRKLWVNYSTKYATEIDPTEIDAAEVCSVEEFSKLFEIWATAKSSKRIKVLMVWHAHFLSLACQQTLRRWLETKSYRCRVWFHVEMLNNVQSAIMSRCILKFVEPVVHTIDDVKVLGEGKNIQTFWKSISNENELREKSSSI